MESYIVRIYRGDKKNPRSLIGIVEEVGIDEKRAFTNLDELWAILQSIKNWPEQSTKSSRNPFVKKFLTEKRDEVRTIKAIPFAFITNENKFNARTVDICKNGLCIEIPKKIPLAIGDISQLKVKDSNMKAQVRWVDHKSDPSVTRAGFKIMDGKLNLRNMNRGTYLVIEGGGYEAL